MSIRYSTVLWTLMPVKNIRKQVILFPKNTEVGKSRFIVVSKQNTVYSCIIIYCIIFHTNCKPTFAHPLCFIAARNKFS